jgi:BirA family biotin operon repressor/biotin-[acetyl-CoA-carboxylase] ligase
MNTTALLPLLADGQFHSGQILADMLGVDSEFLLQELAALSELGLHIETSQDGDHRLPGGIDLLQEDLIMSSLPDSCRVLLSRLCVMSVIDSTNAEAMRQLKSGAGAGFACVAEQQSAGRGRRGRAWVSPFASNLYLSLTWQFAGGAASLEGLSLAVGVAVNQALAACGVQGLKLKWPNDLLHDNAKLGGILVEMIGDESGGCQVIIGIGINVKMPESASAHIDQDWTDISRITATTPSRNKLLAAVLEHLLPMLPEFEKQGFAPWQSLWSELDAFAGRAVIVHSGPQQIAGVARGVNENGALLLEVGELLQVIHGGEVSLRLDT